MNIAYAIDKEGYISHEVMGDFDPAGLVLTAPPTSMVRPRWSGERWVEAASNKRRASVSDEARVAVLLALSREAERVREVVRPLGPYAQAVQEQRLREARALLSGCCKEEPLVLSAEAEAAGLDLKALASQVLEQHAAWARQMGLIEGTLRKHSDRVGKERERAGLAKLEAAGKAALWALVTGVSGTVVLEESAESVEVSEVKESAEVKESTGAVASAELAGTGGVKAPASTAELSAEAVELAKAEELKRAREG